MQLYRWICSFTFGIIAIISTSKMPISQLFRPDAKISMAMIIPVTLDCFLTITLKIAMPSLHKFLDLSFKTIIQILIVDTEPFTLPFCLSQSNKKYRIISYVSPQYFLSIWFKLHQLDSYSKIVINTHIR